MAEQELKRNQRKVSDPHERENERLLKLFNDAFSGELCYGSVKSGFVRFFLLNTVYW